MAKICFKLKPQSFVAVSKKLLLSEADHGQSNSSAVTNLYALHQLWPPASDASDSYAERNVASTHDPGNS